MRREQAGGRGAPTVEELAVRRHFLRIATTPLGALLGLSGTVAEAAKIDKPRYDLRVCGITPQDTTHPLAADVVPPALASAGDADAVNGGVTLTRTIGSNSPGSGAEGLVCQSYRDEAPDAKLTHASGLARSAGLVPPGRGPLCPLGDPFCLRTEMVAMPAAEGSGSAAGAMALLGLAGVRARRRRAMQLRAVGAERAPGSGSPRCRDSSPTCQLSGTIALLASLLSVAPAGAFEVDLTVDTLVTIDPVDRSIPSAFDVDQSKTGVAESYAEIPSRGGSGKWF